MNKPDILMWKFENAPKEYQEMSRNGGDEDYVFLMKKEDYENDYDIFKIVDNLNVFHTQVEEIEKDDEIYVVIITAHG